MKFKTFLLRVPLAQSLIEFGESLRQMADVKYALDDNIKQNVLEPLHHLQTKDLKEVMVIKTRTNRGRIMKMCPLWLAWC